MNIEQKVLRTHTTQNVQRFVSLRTKTTDDKPCVHQRIRVAIQVIKQSAKPTHNHLDRHAHATTTASLVVDCAMLTMTTVWK